MFGFSDLGLVLDIAFWLVTDDVDPDPGTLVVDIAFWRVTDVEVVTVDGTAGLLGPLSAVRDKVSLFVILSTFIVAVVVEAICEFVSFAVPSPQALHGKVVLVSSIVF